MWNQVRYEKEKRDCQNAISNSRKTCSFYMGRYKESIKAQDFETAKAITEVLKPLNYDTADTHAHIKEIN